MPVSRRSSTSLWLVYLLRCSDGSLYTGITNDLPKRLKATPPAAAPRRLQTFPTVSAITADPTL